MFRHYLRVRYGECDAQKVVFNARYGDYVDVAVCEFLRAAGLQDEMVTGAYDFQLVKQTIEWKAPARFDQIVEIAVGVQRLGNTSFTLRAEFRLAGESAVLAIAETVYVLMDAATLRSVPIPGHLRAALTEGAADRVSDHAGYLNASTIDRN